MTRQYFEALASDIGLTLRRIDQVEWARRSKVETVEELAGMIATTCAGTDPQFDRQRFMDRIDQVRKDGLK